MTRPIVTRPTDPAVIAVASAQYRPEEQSVLRTLWSPPGGIRHDVPLGRLAPSESPELQNLRIYRGAYHTRPSIVRLGNALTEPVLTSAIFVTSYSSELLHALTTKGIYELSGNEWVALDGPVLTASSYGQYSLTAWNDRLIYSNGSDKIGEVNNQTRTYAPIAEAPVARYVTTFAGRLLAGYVEGSPSRIQWSVRNNNADWDGLSSGYEDLLSTPGGVVDAVRGIFPISDFDAVVIRTRSVWLIRQTGDLVAPFSFTKLHDTTGTISPWTLTLTPKGIVGLFRDNVYLINSSEAPRPIGDRVRDELLSSEGIDYASACFDAWPQHYCVTVPQADQTTVWRYDMQDQDGKWTKDVYPFPSRRIHSAIYRTAIGMGELTGTMEGLTGPFELLGLQDQRHGIIFATGIAGQTVVRETEVAGWDQHPDEEINDSGVQVRLWSGELSVATETRGVEMVELLVSYRAVRDVPLRMEYSDDGGETWHLGTVATAWQATRTTVVRFSYNLSRDRLMLRLASSDGSGIVIIAGYPRVAEGGEVAS